MAKKDFRSSINNQMENKDNVILKDSNKQLSDKLAEQNKKIEELQKALNNENINDFSYEILLSDIKLGSNCRDDDFMAIEELAKDISKVGQLQPVVISSDNILICGFRRYYAIKSLKKEKILAYKYEKNYEEIKPDLLRLQFTENEQRKNLDNFEIAKIFQDLEVSGLNQTQISENFDKDKAVVSKFLKLNSIDSNIKELIKEIQFLGCSQKKLNAFNLIPNPLGIVGINTLYKIANKENSKEQAKSFLSIFRNKLSDEELNSDYFKINELEIKEEFKIKSGLKYIKQFSTFLDKFSDEEKDKVEKIKIHLSKIEILLGKI